MDEKIVEQINILFRDDEKLRNKLLNVDGDAIQQLRSSIYDISPEVVLEYIEQSKIEELKLLATRNAQIKELSILLIQEYYKKIVGKHLK